MSSQIEFVKSNTKAGFTGKRGNPWWFTPGQGLESRLFEGAVPVSEVEELFGFEILDRPVYVEFDGGLVEVPNKRAWMHGTTGDVFEIHSDGYSGHNYTDWLLHKVLNLVGEADVANAGLLDKGAIGYVQIELPENVVVEGVTIRPFLMATTSFNGKLASTYKTGYTNVVCDNTHECFMREGGDVYRVKHTRNSAFSVVDASAALGILENIAAQSTADISRLLSVDVSDLQWQQFVEAHVPIKEDAKQAGITKAENKREALTQMWRTDVRVQPWAGTAWGVTQAVNTFNQHIATVRNTYSGGREERRMMRAVKGEIGVADAAALATLGTVLGRELITV